jgi:hypothetical protein
VQRLFFAGHARLPQGVPAREVFDSLALSVRCESRFGVILEVDCTLATELGRRFVQDALVGYSLRHDVAEMVRIIETTYHGGVQRALIAALKDLETEYIRQTSAASTEGSEEKRPKR